MRLLSSVQQFVKPHYVTRDNRIAASRFPLLAAVGGSMVTRTVSRRTFLREGRSVVTEDMLSEIGKAFEEVFGEDSQRELPKM